MYNWNTNIKQLKKDKKQYAVWQLEQLVNFGLGGERINMAQLKKHWTKLHLDPKKRRYLQSLLWPQKQS